MDQALKPISFSTLLSVALHLLVLVTLIQTQELLPATGRGIEIELVSSIHIADQAETERAAEQLAALMPAPRKSTSAVNEQVDTLYHERSVPRLSAAAEPAGEPVLTTESIVADTGAQSRTRSTNAAQHRNSIIELLHSKISEHKQYPYLARRQRREGVATVEFVLYPDGSIDNPRLVSSSRTRALDKAALDAVRGIEPFSSAKDYIDRPEAYRVDVVFNVL